MRQKLLVIIISGALGSPALGLSPVPPADNNKLNDVIITATRSEINTTEAPASITVINRKEIETRGAQNIVDIIRGTPGISLQGVGTGGRKTISLRGMQSRHTLILIDGKRIPGSNDVIGPNTDYQYDWIATDRIERIEVVRGPMSVLYGADALGGVINIVTRRPSKKLEGNFKLSNRLANGDFNHDGDGHNIDLNLNGSANDKLQFSVGAQQSRQSSVESKLKPKQSAIEGRKKQQLSLVLDWQPAAQHNINFELIEGNEDRWQDTQTRRKKKYQSQYDIDKEQISLGWKGKLGNTTPSLRIYQSTLDITNKATNGVKPTSPQKLTDMTLEGNISLPIGEKQFITSGFEYRKEELENRNLSRGKDDITIKSLYLQDEIDLNDNLVFTLGARLDDHKVFGKETSPRASLVWNATDKLTLKTSYGHGFRAPNIKQASPDYVFALGTIKITGNKDLKPETNDAFELGANYSTKRFSINAAIFDNKVKDLIDLTGPITDRTYKNISEARLKGTELSTKVTLRKGFNLTSSYQYLDAKDGDNNRLKHRSRHTVSSGITWDKNSWKLNLNTEYLSSQIIEHNRVSTAVPSYTLWNTSAHKSINKNLGITVGIDNLTDVRLEDKSSAFRHEEYPRTLRLELRGKF